MHLVKPSLKLAINGGIAVTVILLILSSCQEHRKNPPPEQLLDEETYIDLLIEFQLIESYYNRYSSRQDTLKNIITMRDEILEKYDASWQQFKNSHNYYKSQPPEQLKRIDEAIQILRKRNQRPMRPPQESNQ